MKKGLSNVRCVGDWSESRPRCAAAALVFTILGLALALVPILAKNATAVLPPTPPVCTNESVTVDAGGTIPIDLTDNCSDVNGDINLSTLIVFNGPAAGTLTPTGPGTFSYQAPAPAPGAPVTFDFTVADNTGLISNVATVSITVTPPEKSKCAAAKYKATGKKVLGKLKCLSKAVKAGDPVDTACLQKAEAKFTLKWGKAEEDADCLTIGDEAAIEAMVDEFVTDIMDTLEPISGP